MRIRTELHKNDLDDFYADIDVDHEEFFLNAAIGAKEYLLKESIKELDKDRKRIFQ